jgi:hypothetical protein
LRFLVADADHLSLVGASAQQLAGLGRLHPRNHAADLARADVEHGHDAGAAGGPIAFAEPAHILRS